MLKKTSLILAGVCTLILMMGTLSFAKAAPSTAGKGVTVIPPSFELYANPGESVSDTLRVRNDAAEEAKYTISVEDFRAVGEEGNVGLVDNLQSDNTYSLAKWIFPEPTSFTVAPGQEKEIPFTINVPKNAEPGGHYGSILIKMGGEGKASTGATVTSRVGSLILLRVSGNVKEEASVASFKADKGYYQKAPVNLVLRVKDTGNNHIKPTGTIVITNIFGKKVAEVDLNGLNVLPGAIRKMSTEWSPKGLLASRYTATLVAKYGQNNSSLSATTSFIVFPRYLIIIIVIVIVALLLAYTNRKKVKKLLHNLTK